METCSMTDEPTTLDLLRRLEEQVQAAIAQCRIGDMRPNIDPHFSCKGCDLVIGDFGIKILPGLEFREAWPNLDEAWRAAEFKKMIP